MVTRRQVSLSIVNVDSCYTAAIEDSLTYLGREGTKVCLSYPLQMPPIYLPLLHQDHKYEQRIIPKLVRWKKSAFPAWCRYFLDFGVISDTTDQIYLSLRGNKFYWIVNLEY